MNPRISTSMMYQQSVSHMLGKQVRINHLSRQLDSLSRIVTAKDDPVAAGAVQRLERTLSALGQYGKNANGVQSRLGLQENALANYIRSALINRGLSRYTNPWLLRCQQHRLRVHLRSLERRTRCQNSQTTLNHNLCL